MQLVVVLQKHFLVLLLLDGFRVAPLGALVLVAPFLQLVAHVGCPLDGPAPLENRLSGGHGDPVATDRDRE
eukprot:2594185-Pyramimonas_sp.AAC.1